MNKTVLYILFLLFGVGVYPVHSQYIPGKLSEEATVSILTVGPAQRVYTTFGHTAIRVKDPRLKIDYVYNYGTFDFESPGFFFKFLYGDLNYFLSVEPFRQFKQENIDLGRSIVSQTLELTQAEKNALVMQLEQNALPQNRTYKYRFFQQNCVIQVRDLLAGHSAEFGFRETPATILSGSTYREMLSPYLTNRPWLQLGVNLMLGAGADQPITGRQKVFLPNSLHLTLANSFSSGQPIVESSKTIARAGLQNYETLLPPVLAFWTIFLATSAFTVISLIQGWQGRWLDQLLFGAVGLLGLIIAMGSLVSLHQPLHQNWNLLWALPTHLVVAIAMPGLSPKWIKGYFLMTLVPGIAIMLVWAFLPQQFPLAIFPLIGAIVIRSMYLVYLADRYEISNILND